MHTLLKHKRFWNDCKSKSKKKIADRLKPLKSTELRSVCSCARNVYNGNVQMPRYTVEKLRPYKKQLKHLGLKPFDFKAKKKIVQKGGAVFLPILATIASSLISSLLNQNG